MHWQMNNISVVFLVTVVMRPLISEPAQWLIGPMCLPSQLQQTASIFVHIAC